MRCTVEQVMERKRVSTRMLADRLGITVPSMYRIRKGQQIPKLGLALRIAAELRTSIHNLWAMPDGLPGRAA